MGTISEPKVRSSVYIGIQFKVALSYIVIIVGILAILNIYPVIVSQNFIFRSKRDTMQDRATLYSMTLSGLDSLTEESVSNIMQMLGEHGNSRVIITDHLLRSLYDNATTENSVGKTILLQEVRRAIQGNDVFYSFSDGHSLDSKAASPIFISGRAVGVVYIYDSDTELAALLSDIQGNLSRISFTISVIIVVLSFLLSRFLTMRISTVLAAIRRVREGDYGHMAKIKGKDEISEIAGEFNLLSERFERVENMRRRFVSDASHELKTPLASVKVLADSIVQNDDMPPELVKDFVADIAEEINRLTKMTEKLLNITRLDAEVKNEIYPVDLAAIIKRSAHMLKPLADLEDIKINLELSDNCYVDSNDEDIYQVVFNLMENAVKYNRHGGRVTVFLFATEEGGATVQNNVNLIVSDTGLGIPEEDIDRIFERFYRVDKARSREAGGSGLGLAIVRNTVLSLNGTIATSSKVGEGTRISIMVPMSGIGGVV